jgi:hypothetical protein
MDTLINDPSVEETDEDVEFYGVDITKELMNGLSENNINLVYCSQFSGQRAFDMLDIIENLKLSQGQKQVTKKRIFSVLVEMLQNISQHGIDLEGMEGKTGILLVGAEKKSNKIITGNIIRESDAKLLRDHLEEINQMNNDELENLFVEKLTDDDFSNPLKNGMGLIDMRIKSGKPLEYNIEKVDDKHLFFTIQVIIDY